MDAMRLLDLGEVSAVRSQALYHGLAQCMTESSPDTIVLCRPSETCFCVGYHQDSEAEVDLEFCRTHHYPVLHRKIGGGTVVLDRDQLFYQVILHASRAPLRVDTIYETFLAAPVATLRALGLPATLEGTNEIEVRGRRIAGTGGGRIGDAMVVTGNLLLDFPYRLMTRAWQTPSQAFRRRAGKALRRSVTTLRKELSNVPSMAGLTELLVQKYRQTLARPLVAGSLTPTEITAVTDAEAEVLEIRVDGSLVSGERVLKIARGVYVREGERASRPQHPGVPPGCDQEPA
jgi:lipoate-protein ligase A